MNVSKLGASVYVSTLLAWLFLFLFWLINQRILDKSKRKSTMLPSVNKCFPLCVFNQKFFRVYCNVTCVSTNKFKVCSSKLLNHMFLHTVHYDTKWDFTWLWKGKPDGRLLCPIWHDFFSLSSLCLYFFTNFPSKKNWHEK